jgi:DNA topoisomerase-1
MTKLVIVESPGKIKKIKSYLGSEYTVMASVGHIRDLAKESISVDPSNNFEPTYQIMADKKKVVAGLKKAASNCSEIIIAADGDREGEAIAQHLVIVLGAKTYKRIVFHEITKAAITKALNSPRQVDLNMFNSQQARRILDRIVGYKLSPILKSVNGLTTQSLGAGRVQSVVTRLIVDKEREIQNFLSSDKSSEFNVSCDFSINKTKFKANLIHNELVEDKINIEKIGNLIDAQQIDSFKEIKASIRSKDQIKIIVINVRSDPIFIISNITNSDRQRHPPQPFITSSLQQEASYKLKFQLKKTMGLAQKLYEKGLITYMRTDSPALSGEALNYIKKQIIEDQALGENYYQYRQFKGKGSAQEAHEAIRPTHFNVFELTDYDLSNTDEEKLYQLIWNRTVASQMKSAKYHDQHIILSNKTNVKFEGTNSVLVFDGYLKLYKDVEPNADQKDDDDDNNNTDNTTKSHIKLNDQDLKANQVSWSKINFKETFKSAPSRYNEPSLVKKLEGLGIGRPSTYAAIISKIQEHKYIRVGNVQGIEKDIMTYTLSYINTKTQPSFEKKATIQKIGNEKLRLIPTSDGELVTDYLIKNFPQIMDYKFTAHMETLLDEIAEGNKIWYEVLAEFYNVLREQFSSLNMNIESSNYVKFKAAIGPGPETTNSEQINSEPTNSDDEFIDSDTESGIGRISKAKNSVKINQTDQANQPNQPNQPNPSQKIGSHPKYGEITYMVTRFGPAFKVNLGGRSKKDLFVGAGKLDPSDKNVLESAIKYIDYKVKKSSENKTSKFKNK